MTASRDEVLDFITECWRAAGPGRENTVDGYLSELRANREKLILSDDLPDGKRKKPAAGFSSARQAFWLNRAALGAWAGPNGVPADSDQIYAFYDRGLFTRRIRKFVASGEYDQWWSSHRVRIPSSIPDRSLVVHGNAKGIFWFGVRSPDEIRAAIKLDPDRFPEKLRQRAASASAGEILNSLTNEQRVALLVQRLDVASTRSVPITTAGRAFNVIASDDVEALERALLGDARGTIPEQEPPAGTKVTDNIPLRPDLCSFEADLKPGEHVLLRGDAGTGKTVAIYQFFKRTPERTFLLVAPRSLDGVANPIRPEDEASIAQLAEHIMSTEQQNVIVIDNLHAADVHQIAGIIRRCPRETTVIAATRDPRAAKMFADALVPTTIINLNLPSLTFIEQLVDYATEYFGVRMTTQRREAFILEAHRFFASAATIVEQLSHYRGQALRGSHAYATQVRVLPEHGALSSTAARILHVIAYLRVVGVRVINPTVLRSYATDCFGLADQEYEGALRELYDEGWIWIGEREIGAPHLSSTDLLAAPALIRGVQPASADFRRFVLFTLRDHRLTRIARRIANNLLLRQRFQDDEARKAFDGYPKRRSARATQ